MPNFQRFSGKMFCYFGILKGVDKCDQPIKYVEYTIDDAILNRETNEFKFNYPEIGEYMKGCVKGWIYPTEGMFLGKGYYEDHDSEQIEAKYYTNEKGMIIKGTWRTESLCHFTLELNKTEEE